MALCRSFNAVSFIRQRLPYQVICRQSHAQYEKDYGGMDKIGNRDFLCYGINGQPTYFDRIDFPFPSVRFKENTPDVMILREKEKGDWKNLSLLEKKSLYRASFCQTFAEVYAPTGFWKAILATWFCVVSAAIWVFLGVHSIIGDMKLVMQPEQKKELVQLLIDRRVDPITGIGSQYDYENKRWKD